MPSSPAVTETLILSLKPGIRLDATDSPDAKAFAKLLSILKAQPGFVCQYWGHQVKLPHLVVWLIDWESYEYYTLFVESEDYKTAKTSVGEMFDLETSPPLTTLTNWSSPAAPALKAPVTEFAYFTLPAGSGEKEKDEVWKTLSSVPSYVETVGGAVGSAVGWVFQVSPPSLASVPWLHGVYGYPNIETHMKWREMPEHDVPVKAFQELADKGIVLEAAEVPGVDAETGWFHVCFREG